MKAPKNNLDVTLQAEIVRLGQILSGGACRIINTPTIAPDALASETQRILGMVRKSPARILFGIKQNTVDPEDATRLKAFALIAWHMLGDVQQNCVSETALAIIDPNGIPCEQTILARDLLGRMVCDGVLGVAPNSGDYWDGRLTLPKTTFSWFCGGQESKGDFDPHKLDLARLRRGGVRGGVRDGKEDANNRGKSLTARQLYETVRKEVHGLDPQIKVLASRIALHTARAEWLKAGNEEHAIGNTVILLAGSSGSGKSFLVERMAVACKLPFVQVDSTSLTASGFVGADVDSLYQLATQSVGGNPAEASRGIIFLDEFDKKSSRYGRDVGGEAVQMELLSKLQSSATPFIVGGKRANDGQRAFLFDGRPTAYCLAGVFSGLDEVIERESGRRGIGFSSGAGARPNVHIADCLKKMGFLDELVNRISCVVRLPDPSFASVQSAVSKTIVEGFNNILLPRGIYLMPSESAIREIAGYAIESKAYYRGAKAVLATLVEELMFDPPPESTVIIERADVRRATNLLATGVVQSDEKPREGVTEAISDDEPDAQPDQKMGG
jgi:ATP-dependent Clp protease ATP-binding subunit ClpX